MHFWKCRKHLFDLKGIQCWIIWLLFVSTAGTVDNLKKDSWSVECYCCVLFKERLDLFCLIKTRMQSLPHTPRISTTARYTVAKSPLKVEAGITLICSVKCRGSVCSFILPASVEKDSWTDALLLVVWTNHYTEVGGHEKKTRWWLVLSEGELRAENWGHCTLTNVKSVPLYKCQAPIQSVSQSLV